MHHFLNLLAVLPAVIAAPFGNDLPRRQEPGLIPNQWLVQAAPGQSFDQLLADVAGVLNVESFQPEQEFHINGFEGFKIEGSPEVAEQLNALTSVEAVQQDAIVEIQDVVSQADPPYGLARISSRTPGATTYRYDESAGTGSFVYVMDTGINIEHEDFGGRASFGFSVVPEEANTDFHGHGTHVAATAAGTRFGVAKNASIIDVKIIGRTGRSELSNLVQGMDWALNDIRSKGRLGRSVINMSVGADRRRGETSFLDRGATALVDAGIFLSVSSGNANVDVDFYSPPRAPGVCAVGASDSQDRRASFSNFGSRVDVLAPGVDITSAWIGNNNAIATISGTSMAAPYVAGLGAYLIGSEGPSGGRELCSRIAELSTKNALTGLRGEPNRLAFNGVAA